MVVPIMNSVDYISKLHCYLCKLNRKSNFQLRRVPHNYANIVAHYEACCS